MPAEVNNTVTLVVNGAEFGGFKSVRIETGIERQARSFDMAVTDTWPGSTSLQRRVAPGDACQIYIGSDRVATGYVDATPIRYDGGSYSVGVRGRSKTGDLVDCCPSQGSKTSGGGAAGQQLKWQRLGIQGLKGTNNADSSVPAARAVQPNGKGGTGGQWRGAKLEQIAADMAAEYGINVVAEVDTGAPLVHQVQQGDTVFESIDRMLRLRHCLATDNALGELVLIVAGSGGKASTALVLGQNIRSSDTALDFSKVFSEYIAKGQKSVTSQQSEESENGEDTDTEVTTSFAASASATDSRVTRRRLLVIKQSGQADEGSLADRVRYERAHRAAKALETTYTVDGWRQDSGALWVQNQQVRVVDGLIGFDTDMLIAHVIYILDEQGQRCELRVGPLDGYVSAAQKKTAKSGAGKGVKNRFSAGGLDIQGVN